MLRKIISVVIDMVFPKTHLQIFLENCSLIEFESKLTPQPQQHTAMFYPFYYKDLFIKDCIIELKERNNSFVAHRFGPIVSRWIMRKIDEIGTNSTYYLTPVPQHKRRTLEKGFCHTTTLAHEIHKELVLRGRSHVFLKPCIVKEKHIKKLHAGFNKKRRNAVIKNSMRAYITKQDAERAYFFIIDDVYTTGATFKEVRRSLSDCAVPDEKIFYVSIAH